jgi:uncharacterized protein YkwD
MTLLAQQELPMKTWITSVAVVIAFTALVLVPAGAQINRDKKPADDLLGKPTKGELPLPKWDRLDAIDQASRVVSLVNGLRAKKGTRKLKPSASLDKIAKLHADQMASRDRLGDVEPMGRDRLSPGPGVLTDWFGQFGMQPEQGDPAAAQVKDWLRSRPYMLSTKVTVIGVGASRSASGRIYFCQLFANPK